MPFTLPTGLSANELRILEAYAQVIQAERRAKDPLVHWQPHAKQQAFIDAVLGDHWYENWLVSSNRFGKTDAGVFCDAQLVRYGIEPTKPSVGAASVVWDRAVSLWVVGPDYGTLTGVLLPKLLDWPGIEVPPGSAHQPFIPRWEIESWHADEQRAKLKNGSLLRCKSNEQAQIRFAAAGVDAVHFDEEPFHRNYEEVTLRVEAGRRLRIYGTCTLLPPEGQVGGVSWLYQQIIRPYLQGKRDIGLFGGSIWDNPHLLPEEIARLEAKYPEGSPQYRIRLGGEWLPGLGGNQCYLKFRTQLHVKPQQAPVWHAPLCWFIDFNVNPFCSGVGQYLNRRFHVYKVFELEDGNIDDMVAAFRQAYPTHGAEIWLYGDATGEGRSVQTAQSNYTLIRRAMQDYPMTLKLNIPLANPHRKDRVNAVNRALQDNNGVVSVEIDPSCEHLILDLEGVIADNEGGPKKTTNSRDPYFFRTHSCLVGETLVDTVEGPQPISMLRVGDRVLLPTGTQRITAVSFYEAPRTLTVRCSNGTQITCTPEHKFLTDTGLVTADALRYGDTILTEEHPLCQHAVSALMATPSSLGLRDAITVPLTKMTRGKGIFSTSIAISGREHMAPFLQTITSIMPMGTPSITPWPTLNVFQGLSICASMPCTANGLGQGGRLLPSIFTETKLPSGMQALREWPGIVSRAKMDGRHASVLQSSVRSVTNHLSHPFLREPCIVHANVKPQHAVSLASTTKPVCVPSAGSRTSSTAMKRTPPVVVAVDEGVGGTVYDLTVEHDHCYVANGLLVSNSDGFGYWVNHVAPVVGMGDQKDVPIQRHAIRPQSPFARAGTATTYAAGGRR